MKTILILAIMTLGLYGEAKDAKKADTNIVKACAKEIKKFCAKEKTDKDKYNCLETHDKDLSASCDKVHEAFGIANGLEPAK
ncbi:MAG: hypothetical protein ACXVAX_03910 [Pseudobdellovibrio sp.]